MTCNSCSNYPNYPPAPPQTNCPDALGCPADVCPDIVLRRHDTKPSLKVRVEDCDGPMDLTGLVLEATMWANGKLKKKITSSDEYFALADNIGFEQIMVGDTIIMDRARRPEQMLVTAFDETNYFVKVQRGYHGTPIQDWKKGTPLRIIKFTGAAAQTEMVYQDVIQIDGTTQEQLTDSLLVYEWGPTDTCLPGCYWLEFKLLKMSEATSVMAMASDEIVPSFTDSSLTPADFGCGLGAGVEWIRRFPLEEGFLVKITDSITSDI